MSSVLVDCFFYKFYMDQNEFLKYNMNNIAFRTTSREYFMGDVDRTSLNYEQQCPESRVVFSMPNQGTNAPRALSDNVTCKNEDRCLKIPQFSHSEGTNVNVVHSNVSKFTLSLPTPTSESFERRRSSFNLSTFFKQTM